ncbi:MAG: hypothetical protein MJZ93_03140 [Paludibacteraceae bacterium]|nr:hypothetical protein [Paludibacteraceae bacterium]
MKNETIKIRLMQTRSLEHLWNQQKCEPELTLHEFVEMLAVEIVHVSFSRRDSDQATKRPQQRLVVRVNDHISVELRCRLFEYETNDGGCIELFSIGGIREIVTPYDAISNVLNLECRIELLDWTTIKDLQCNNANVEKTLMDKIAQMEVVYAIEDDADVLLVRRYLNERQRLGDLQVADVIRAFNRIVNPEKYRSE